MPVVDHHILNGLQTVHDQLVHPGEQAVAGLQTVGLLNVQAKILHMPFSSLKRIIVITLIWKDNIVDYHMPTLNDFTVNRLSASKSAIEIKSK